MAGKNGVSKSKKKDAEKVETLTKITSIFEKKVGGSDVSEQSSKQDGQRSYLTSKTAPNGTSKSIKQITAPTASGTPQIQSSQKSAKDSETGDKPIIKTPSLKRSRNVSSPSSAECDRKNARRGGIDS